MERGFNVNETMIILYSHLAKENLAWLFQVAGYNISEERAGQGLAVIRLCDMNKNGILDTGDATIVLRKVVGLEPTLPEDISIGDMNGNGILDTEDAMIILRKVVGLE